MGCLRNRMQEQGLPHSAGSGEHVPITEETFVEDGGPGSGNFGHSGRPGKVGGSGPGGGKAFRVQTTSGQYTGIHKAKAFKSIAKQARSCENVHEFIDSLSNEQRDAVLQQYRQSGTKQSVRDYTERLRQIMSKQKRGPVKHKGVVEGKDIREGYTWDGQPYKDPVTGQTVDTEIEHVMSKQGYFGAPRVVSQKEFDRITKQNPNMPILYRSFAAKNPEQLQDFDDQIEEGEWYVDCETGGAQYGQGMYCVGVYPQEPLYRWDAPELDEDTNWDAVVFTDSKGNGFVTVKQEHPEEGGDLYVGTPYLFIGKDGKRRMLKMDDEGVWADMNTGEYVPDSDVDEQISSGATIYECKDQDLGVYADAYTKERERGTKGAMEEMKHYRSISTRRIAEEATPEPPEGMKRATYLENGEPQYFYYDPEKSTPVSEKKPPVGSVVVFETGVDYIDRHDKKMWRVGKDGRLISLDGDSAMQMEDVDPKWKWSKIEGKCDDPKLAPAASTRVMTLDPSAKIITYKELMAIRDKGTRIRAEARYEREKEVEEYVKSCPEDTQEGVRALMKAMWGESVTNIELEKAKRVKQDHPELVEGAQKALDDATARYEERVKEAYPYDRLGLKDPGVVAAMLGYDAINAEGHGDSGSYTVVLNRSKLIVSEQRVDVD